MTRGNFKRTKEPGELAVFAKARDLIKHSFQITSNAKRFPKRVRFTIVDRIQNKSLEIYECLLEANEIFPTDDNDKKERKKLQRQALTFCKELLFFIEMSHELGYINIKSCEHWSKMTLDVKYMTAAWVKKDKSRF